MPKKSGISGVCPRKKCVSVMAKKTLEENIEIIKDLIFWVGLIVLVGLGIIIIILLEGLLEGLK